MVKLVKDENVTAIENIGQELLEFNNGLDAIFDNINNGIEEVYSLHDKITKLNNKLHGTGNDEKLYFISLISKDCSVVRNRLIQIKLNIVRDLRKYETIYKKFYDRLILVVDGSNAEARQAKASGYLVVLYDIVARMKNLAENIDIALNDLNYVHSSLKLQFFIIKTDLKLSTEGEEEITF